MLKYALLGFLNYSPRTGYELEATMSQSTNKFWHARLSQIYMTLKKLEQESLITSQVEAQEGRPDKRVYTITETGRADLYKWLSQPQVELVPVKETLLLKLFFARPIGKEKVLTQLRIQRELHQRELDALTALPKQTSQLLQERPELREEALFWGATLRFGQMYAAMYLKWLEETIESFEHSLSE